MVFRILLILHFLFFDKSFSSEITGILTFPVNERHILVPYNRTRDNLHYLTDILSDPRVYWSFGDGTSPSTEKIFRKHNSYMKRNQIYECSKPYDPINFGFSWLLVDPSGKGVGIAGFRPDDGLKDYVTEIFCFLKGSHQGQGFGFQIFKTLTRWFLESFPKETLFWLSKPHNDKSVAIAHKLNFKPVFQEPDDENKQSIVGEGDKAYLVFSIASDSDKCN